MTNLSNMRILGLRRGQRLGVMDGSDLDDIARALPDFVVTGQIGRGAFGVVWAARHRRLDRDVAVKELAESPLVDDVERFRGEARILARLDHPNVIKVFDYREHEGRRLLIMEMLRGGTMVERHRGAPELPSVIEAGIAAAWGLQHAHDHGILHRDVKPGNLMFDERGRVKVTDFGIASGIAPEGGSLQTRDGSFLGTPAYAAPEQAAVAIGHEAAAVTEASDQYSLAAALYETLSGQLTHDPTGGAIALWQRRCTEPARAIHEAVPELPSAVGDVLVRALERLPNDRFPSMAAFADALQTASGNVPGERSMTAMAALRNVGSITPTAAHLALTTDARPRWQGSTPTLVGRDADAAELSALLGTHRLVTIAAPGGTGKTSLASALAVQPVGANVDGTWIVYLANAAEHADVPMVMARALEIRDDASDSTVDAIFDRLSEQRSIVVLDNCEHVIEAAADMAAQLLARCPEVTVLATSREPLRIDAEHVYRLPQLTVAPEGVPLPELLAASATELFVLRARVHQPAFRVTADNAEAVNSVARRLDGVPLALELAAARMRSMAVTEIAERLDQRFRLLTTGERNVDPRQRTLRGAIEWSFDLLTPVEQFSFCRASVFVGGFDLDAGAAVLLEDDAADRFDVVDRIDTLMEKSLLYRHEDARGRSRYHMLESIREYARERLASAGPSGADEARSVHLDHFLAVAEELGPRLVGPQQIEANALLRADHDNLIAALVASTSVPDGVDRGLRLASALHYYWTRNGVAAAMILPVEVLCERSDDGALRALGLAVLARAYCAVSRAHDALETAQRAVDLTPLGPSTTSLRALQSRVLAYSYMGDPKSALIDVDALYRGAEDSGDTIIQAEARSMRSVNLRSLGHAVESRSDCRAVVALYRSLGDILGYASELINLADHALEAGDLDEAEASMRAAEPLVEQLDSPIVSSYFHGNCGLVALRRGRGTIAMGEFAKAIVICERINERSNLLNNLIAYVHVLARSDPRMAAQLLAAAETLAARFGLAPDPNEQLLLDETEQFLRPALGKSELEVVRQSPAGLSMREIAVLVADRRA